MYLILCSVLDSPSIDRKTKLKLYGLYKQATLGNCNKSRPSFFNIPGRRKWDAWSHYLGTDPDEAKTQYISIVDEIQSSQCPGS